MLRFVEMNQRTNVIRKKGLKKNLFRHNVICHLKGFGVLRTVFVEWPKTNDSTHFYGKPSKPKINNHLEEQKKVKGWVISAGSRLCRLYTSISPSDSCEKFWSALVVAWPDPITWAFWPLRWITSVQVVLLPSAAAGNLAGLTRPWSPVKEAKKPAYCWTGCAFGQESSSANYKHRSANSSQMCRKNCYKVVEEKKGDLGNIWHD